MFKADILVDEMARFNKLSNKDLEYYLCFGSLFQSNVANAILTKRQKENTKGDK